MFVNPNLNLKQESTERTLFAVLASKEDAKAFDAFIKLTIADPKEVAELADEHERSMVRANFALPTFPYRFLKQLVLLTAYSREKGVDFQGSAELKAKIEKLKQDLSYSERYRLENEMIESLSLDSVTAFEYWALIYSTDWGLTHSAGRILDKFYSRRWQNLLADERHLTLYLKKSALYERLGIIGSCNNFLNKFANSPNTLLTRLEKLKSSDKDIAEQIERIAKLQNPVETVGKDEWIVEMSYKPLPDLEKRLAGFPTGKPLTDDQQRELSEIMSQVSYQQLGTALEYFERIDYKAVNTKYRFLPSDWGLRLAGDFEDENVRREFLSNYRKFSQAELYAYYLDKHGLDYRRDDKSLDFDKIYAMLKYDIVMAFAGGGGGTEEGHVYPLIKLLEIEFKTTLDFPDKLCRSRDVYGCSADDRAEAWMKFLREKNLLRLKHDEPASFSGRW